MSQPRQTQIEPTYLKATQLARELVDYLYAEQHIAALLPQLKQLQQLQDICTQSFPQWKTAIKVSQYQNGQVTLRIENTAVASKLRQLLPQLQQAFLQHGRQVSSIQLRLQAMQNTAWKKTTVNTKPSLSHFARTQLNQLAQQLPDSALQTAISNLAKR